MKKGFFRVKVTQKQMTDDMFSEKYIFFRFTLNHPFAKTLLASAKHAEGQIVLRNTEKSVN
jgi:hypothetical protein